MCRSSGETPLQLAARNEHSSIMSILLGLHAEVAGLEEDIELDEIAAPSISLAYGIKDYPVNIGIAFQKGKRYANQNQEEKRVLLFMAFDMPLFAF